MCAAMSVRAIDMDSEGSECVRYARSPDCPAPPSPLRLGPRVMRPSLTCFLQGKTLKYIGVSRGVQQSLRLHLARCPSDTYFFKVRGSFPGEEKTAQLFISSSRAVGAPDPSRP